MSAKRFRRPLAREITAVILVKIALIVLASVFLFDASQRPHVDAAVMYSHLFKP